MEPDFASRVAAALTEVRGVNKTDVLTTTSRFSSLAELFQADMQDLTLVPGIGPTKVRRLHDAFNLPFRPSMAPDSSPPDPTQPGSQAQPSSQAQPGGLLEQDDLLDRFL